MKYPVNYTEKIYKRKINPNAKFIMIGNNIDGNVDFDFCEFQNFEQLKLNLLNYLQNLKACGEWRIELYQVTKPYTIKRRYGYYKYPSRGKLIFTHSYMDCPIKEIIFQNKQIIFIGSFIEVEENWHYENQDFYKYDLTLEVIKLKYI